MSDNDTIGIHYEMRSDVCTVNGEQTKFSYYVNPPMSTKLSFVTAVVNIVVGDDYYYPVIRDMAFDFCLVNYFSDIDPYIATGSGMAEETIDDVERFLEETDAPRVIRGGVEPDVIVALERCVDAEIEYKTGIHPSPIADSVSSLVRTIEGKLSDFDVENLNDMAKVLGRLTGDVTPEKMLDAYANSDVFKKMHEDAVKRQDERDKKASKRAKIAKGVKKALDDKSDTSGTLNMVKGNVSLDGGDIASTE